MIIERHARVTLKPLAPAPPLCMRCDRPWRAGEKECPGTTKYGGQECGSVAYYYGRRIVRHVFPGVGGPENEEDENGA